MSETNQMRRDRRTAGLAVAVILLASCLIGVVPDPAQGVSCDPFRHEVRTLSDDLRRSVDLTPERVSVEHLRGEVRPPSIVRDTPRFEGIERQTYELHVRLVRVVVRSSGEIDLTVSPRDDVRTSMRVLFNPEACIPLGYRRPQQVDARARFLKRCGSLPVDRGVRLKGLATVEGVGFWGPQPDGSNGLTLAPVLGFSGDCWKRGSQLVVAAVGDSVPARLIDPIADAAGWHPLDAAPGGCPVSGEEPVNRQGVGWTTEWDCRDAVPPEQRAALAHHPDLFLWWDRPSVSHIRTFDGTVLLSSDQAFWNYRKARLDRSVKHLTRDGALVVFVATEPMGIASDLADAKPWKLYFIDHYDDHVVRWNDMLRTYAEAHPQLAAFVSITGDVCHPIASPCDDTIAGTGRPARSDGVHYDGRGVDLVYDALMAKIADVIARVGG